MEIKESHFTYVGELTQDFSSLWTTGFLAVPATFLLLWPSRNKASRSYLWRKDLLGPQFDKIELIMEKVWQQSLGLVVFIILYKSQNVEIEDSKWARLKTSRPASQWLHGGPFHTISHSNHNVFLYRGLYYLRPEWGWGMTGKTDLRVK